MGREKTKACPGEKKKNESEVKDASCTKKNVSGKHRSKTKKKKTKKGEKRTIGYSSKKNGKSSRN